MAYLKLHLGPSLGEMRKNQEAIINIKNAFWHQIQSLLSPKISNGCCLSFIFEQPMIYHRVMSRLVCVNSFKWARVLKSHWPHSLFQSLKFDGRTKVRMTGAGLGCNGWQRHLWCLTKLWVLHHGPFCQRMSSHAWCRHSLYLQRVSYPQWV